MNGIPWADITGVSANVVIVLAFLAFNKAQLKSWRCALVDMQKALQENTKAIDKLSEKLEDIP